MPEFSELRMLQPDNVILEAGEILFIRFSSSYQRDNKCYTVIIHHSLACDVAMRDASFSHNAKNEWIYVLKTTVPKDLQSFTNALFSEEKYVSILPSFNVTGNRPHDDSAYIIFRPPSVAYQLIVDFEFSRFDETKANQAEQDFYNFLIRLRNWLVEMLTIVSHKEPIYAREGNDFAFFSCHYTSAATNYP